MNKIKRQIKIIGTASVLMAFSILLAGVAFAEDAPRFQVSASADAANNLDDFKTQSVTNVTDALGAPSAAWFNSEDDTLIDYIYIGSSIVHTFHVKRDGKLVEDVASHPRAEWESSVCVTYTDCPELPA